MVLTLTLEPYFKKKKKTKTNVPTTLEYRNTKAFTERLESVTFKICLYQTVVLHYKGEKSCSHADGIKKRTELKNT